MTWLDVTKLTVPFITAILMVWIKATIERYLLRKNKQHALSRLISEEVGDLPNAVNAIKQIAVSASNQKLMLVSIDISTLIAKICSDVSDLDAKHAYCYSDLMSSIEIANKGLSRLSSFIEKRAASDGEKIVKQLDRAILGQTKILASDFISLGRASLKVLNMIPLKHRYQDVQGIDALKNAITTAEHTMENWPDKF